MTDDGGVELDRVKSAVLAALIMNGWGTVFEEWWKTYNSKQASGRADIDRVLTAYLHLLANDVAEALVNGHYADGVAPDPTQPPETDPT